MSAEVYPYEPDYTVPPGWILEDYLDTWELSQVEFARLCDRSPDLIGEIIAGVAPVESDTAREFEKVSGLDASTWLNMEASYRQGLEQGKKVPDFKKESVA